MSLFLIALKITFDYWETLPTVYNVMRVLGLIGWVLITYKVVTLKYKWLRKLAGIN